MNHACARTLAPLVVLASPACARPVVVADGTAGPDAQAFAAFLVFLPIVAVLVFALARAAGWRA